jgi:hypothetical protein
VSPLPFLLATVLAVDAGGHTAAPPAGAAPVAPVDASGFALLDAGNYLEKDLGARPEARVHDWLALCTKGGKTELRSVQVQIRPFRSGAVDDGPKQKSGREVIAPGSPEPIALLRGPGLRPGKVVAVTHDNGKLTFAGAEYVIRRDMPEPATEDLCGKGVVHLLWSGAGSKQPLLESDFCTVYTLRFVGDLDRDGKLDVLAVENLDSGSTRLHLFLSKGAPAGSPVRRVATFLHP